VWMSERMNTGNLSLRFKACYFLSALNLAAMALPILQAPHPWALPITGIVVNVVACWLILRGVEPSQDPNTHETLGAFGRRGNFVVASAAAILLVVLGFTERLTKQAIPFALFGFGYTWVALKVLDMSTARWLDELRAKT
jgi:hypothetical protein